MSGPPTCRASESICSSVSLKAAEAQRRTIRPCRAAVSCGRTRPQLLERLPQLLEPLPAWQQSSGRSNSQAMLASQAASQSQAPIITLQVNATEGPQTLKSNDSMLNPSWLSPALQALFGDKLQTHYSATGALAVWTC